MILAGDIGGTKTLLGLFDTVVPRPQPLVIRSYGTLDHVDLPAMIAVFMNETEAAAARTAHGPIASA